MAIIHDNLNLSTVTLWDFAADWVIGSAATTVDIVSSIIIPQTTLGRNLTISNPTDAKSWLLLRVQNSGTVRFQMYNINITPWSYKDFEWNWGWWTAATDNSIWWRDVRVIDDQPQVYGGGIYWEFKQSNTIWITTANWIPSPSSYAWLQTFRRYATGTDFSWWPARQEAELDDGRKYYRLSTSATTRWPWILMNKLSNDFDIQNLLQLNGSAKVSLNGEVSWSNRFITMTAWVRVQETSWYHDINMPAVGTAIPVSNGTTVIVTAATAGQTWLSWGIALNNRQSLWYRVPKWSSAWIVAANFRIQNYSDSTTWVNGIMWIAVNPTQDASEWVLICSRDDNNQFKFWTGDTAWLWFQFWQWMDIQEASSRQSDKSRYLINGYAFRPRNLTSSTTSFWFNWYIRTISTGWNNWYSNSSGYRDINVPAVGTVIYWVWWVANSVRRATTANDAMYRMWETYLWEWPNASTPVMDFANTYQALWFAHDVNWWTWTGTWYITSYGNNFSIPPHWIFIAQRDESGLINIFTWERLNRWEFLRQAKREQILNKSRFTITSKWDFDCRFTQANFFSGTWANGIATSSNTAWVLIHRQDNNGMMAAMDSDQWRPYTRLNIPADWYAIPMLDTAGTRTRVVQTLWGRKYIPLSARESLIYIPQQNWPSSSTVDRGWFVVNYWDSRHIPANAMTIATWSADGSTSWASVNKTRIKMWDWTYIQPWNSIAVWTPTRWDHAQGTMIWDWRDVIVAGSTPIAWTAPLAAVIWVAWNYWAPYTAKYKYQTTTEDPRWEIKLKGIIALNWYVIGTPNIAFIAWVSLFEQQIIWTIATGSIFWDAKPIYTQLRFNNWTVWWQNWILIQIYGWSMWATAPNWSWAWIPAWISLDNITLHLW